VPHEVEGDMTMSTYSFSLLTGETGPLVKGSSPDRLSIPAQAHTPILAEGDQVLSGTKIAKARLSGLGDLHAPLAGTIREITPEAIVMDVGRAGHAPESPAPEEGGEELKEWLRSQGVSVRHLEKVTTLVVNAVPPEPGISTYDPLLKDYRKTVELGLETIQRIAEPSKVFLVAAKGNKANAFPNCTVLHVSPVYPNGLDQLVLKTVTGEETLIGKKPNDAAIFSVSDLYFIGRVMETSRPLTETVMTLGGKNHLIKIGTPIGHLVKEAGATVMPGDRVVLGGLMRGMTALNLQQGVDKSTTGLTILRSKEGLIPTDNFCLGCGECERHCPARILPGMISRCSEFKQFERAEDFHIHSCIECGLCSYWCKAQRPLLQYIRLAKYEIALLRTSSDAREEEFTSKSDQQDEVKA